MDHTPFPGEYLYNDTMRRLQKMEEGYITFTSHIATEELKFAQISEQITQLGDKLGAAMDDLSKQVDTLSQKSGEHSAQLASILEVHDKESQAAKDRKKWFWRLLGVVGIPLGAALARFGEVAWDYFFTKK